MSTCNICGGTEFEAGPNGRLGPDGRMPRCVGCRSLERHRTLHSIAAMIPAPMLSWRRALHFAPDMSLDRGWFRTYETSQYEGENSIDLREIDRPDGAYDFLSLSLVLEFIEDDRRAFSELVRIGSESCILHCTFDSTFEDATSTHYDEPHGAYGRYHGYGLDLEDWFDAEGHDLSTLMVKGTDPVTDHTEFFHFFCRQQSDAETLNAAFAQRDPGSIRSFNRRRG